MKKKRSGSRRWPLVLFVLAAAVAGPAFFLLGYAFKRTQMAIQQFRRRNSRYDFWLTPEQCMRYLKKTNRYNEVNRLLAGARGDENSPVYQEYQPILNALGRDLARLKSLPPMKWKMFRENVARTNVFLLCLVTWCALAVGCHLPLNGHIVATVIDEYTRLALFLPDLIRTGGNPHPLGRDLLWAVANQTFWPIVLYFPLKQVAGYMVRFSSKRPEEVTFGSVTNSLQSGQVKAAFAATLAKNLEPVVEIVDGPASFESVK